MGEILDRWKTNTVSQVNSLLQPQYTILLSNSKVIGLEWITHTWIPYLPTVAIYNKYILRPSQPIKNARESQNIKMYSNDIEIIIGNKFNLDSHFLWNIVAYSCRCPLQ